MNSSPQFWLRPIDSRLIYIFVLYNMNMEAVGKGAFRVHLLRKEIISQWWALGYIGRRADFHKSTLPVIHFLCLYCKKEISFYSSESEGDVTTFHGVVLATVPRSSRTPARVSNLLRVDRVSRHA